MGGEINEGVCGMSDKKFYVVHDGSQLGPFSVTEIVIKLNQHQFEPSDYVYDDEIKDWIMLIESEPIKIELRRLKPKAQLPEKAPQSDSNVVPLHKYGYKRADNTNTKNELSDIEDKNWYILKGENRFGPFPYKEVLRMLQEKVVYEFDYAWHDGMRNWQRMAEIADFSEATIRQFLPKASEVFFRRNHARRPFTGTVLAHDNQTVWKGKGFEISVGGVGVVMDNAMLAPGQTIQLHFKPYENLPSFNAHCEIVSKRYEKSVKERNASVRYGLKFTDLSEDLKAQIQYLVQSSTKESLSIVA